MSELSPDLGARLGKLLPRLASDAPGEVVATAAAIGRTLTKAGWDWHDLTARLTAPQIVTAQPRPQPCRPRTNLEAMSDWLCGPGFNLLNERQRDFARSMARLLAHRRTLTLKQENYLRDLYAVTGGKRHG